MSSIPMEWAICITTQLHDEQTCLPTIYCVFYQKSGLNNLLVGSKCWKIGCKKQAFCLLLNLSRVFDVFDLGTVVAIRHDEGITCILFSHFVNTPSAVLVTERDEHQWCMC